MVRGGKTLSAQLQTQVVAQLADVADPGALEFSVGDGDWPFRGFLVRWQGEVYAYANVCPHAGHPLNLEPTGFFTPDKTLLICASHGAVFDPLSGECAGGPCIGQALRPLDVQVEGDAIIVTAPGSMRA